MFERIPPIIKKDNRAEEMETGIFVTLSWVILLHAFQSLASHPTVMEEADFVITDLEFFVSKLRVERSKETVASGNIVAPKRVTKSV